MTDFPTFGWSWSRHRMYRECPRKYWIRYYLAHGGWRPGADELCRRSWMLSRLLTFPLLVGQVVHEIARDIAMAVRGDRLLPVFDELWEPAWARLVRVRKTTRAEFTRDPKGAPMLADAYYRSRTDREISDEMKEAGDALSACVSNALELPLWEEVRAADVVRAPEKRFSRPVRILGDPGEVIWWGVPDLAFLRRREGVHLVDYKTGTGLDAAEGSQQLHSYAAFMTTAGSTWGPGWRGRLIGLRSATEIVIEITEEEISHAFARLEADVREWRRCQGDRRRNHATAEAFPLTEDRSRCPYCPFIQVCEEVRNPGGAVARFPE